MTILLAILQLIGALPEIIETLKMIWEKIKEIRDKKERSAKRSELRGIIYKAMHTANSNRGKDRKLSAIQNDALNIEISDLERRVQVVLENQA
jgi:hypothetical protein